MSHQASSSSAPERPLVISLLLGISGWLAGVFTLGFVGLLFRPDSSVQSAVSGLCLLGAAWGLFKTDRDGTHVFVSQLALALSIAGQCLVLYALGKDSHRIAPISGAAVLLQITLAVLMPNRLHRTLSTFFALIAWALTVRFTLFGEPGNWAPPGGPHTASLPAALAAWLLAWGPVAAALWYAIRQQAAWAEHRWFPLCAPIVTGLMAGLAVATLASQPFEASHWLGAAGTDIGHLALWPLLSALGALGALMAAFELRQRALMAICVVATLCHVSHFYYALGTSLLTKSWLMLVTGVMFLLAANTLRSKAST